MITGSLAKRIEVEVLARENARLRDALERIRWLREVRGGESFEAVFSRAQEIAREALAPAAKAETKAVSPDSFGGGPK